MDTDLRIHVTALLASNDPACLLSENPDCPPDEYEYEAQEILRRLAKRSSSESCTLSVVTKVFEKELGRDLLSSSRLHAVAHEIHLLLARPTPPR